MAIFTLVKSDSIYVSEQLIDALSVYTARTVFRGIEAVDGLESVPPALTNQCLKDGELGIFDLDLHFENFPELVGVQTTILDDNDAYIIKYDLTLNSDTPGEVFDEQAVIQFNKQDNPEFLRPRDDLLSSKELLWLADSLVTSEDCRPREEIETYFLQLERKREMIKFVQALKNDEFDDEFVGKIFPVELLGQAGHTHAWYAPEYGKVIVLFYDVPTGAILAAYSFITDHTVWSTNTM